MRVLRHTVVTVVLLPLAAASVGTDLTIAQRERPCVAISAPKADVVTIPPVTQTTKSNQRTSTAQSDSGELQIIGVDEQITAPAGTFSTVRFTRTLNKPRGTEVTDVWRSTQYGVTVKRVVTTPRTTATEVLLAIR